MRASVASRRAWRDVARRQGAMLVPRQGRREQPYRRDMGATEDAESGRAARPDGSADVSPSPPLSRGAAAADRVRVERMDAQLRRWTAQERREQEELVG